jgi:hypothetical protein
MNKITFFLAAILISTVFTACGAATKTIMSKSQGERTDVFMEVTDGSAMPRGYGEVIIKANIKTHLEGYYIGESKESVHGRQSYPFLVNIDGQAALWNAPGVRDNKPAYDDEGKTSRDPEARDGMKYVLEKKVRVAAGPHKVFFGLPEDNYYTEADITVQNGATTVLEYKPVYRYKKITTRIPTFLNGISRYELLLNGNKLTT